MADFLVSAAEALDKGRQSTEATARTRDVEPLWRQMLGDSLRARRHDRAETLDDVAGRAGVSPQYLSEIERGRKEPSSEMIQAVAGALELTLVDLTLDVASRLLATQQSPHTQVSASRSAYALAA